MAIGGTLAIPACLVRLTNGQLEVGHIHYHGAGLVEHDLERAVERLRAGEVFRLRATTDQVIKVKQMLGLPRPIDKRQDIIRELKECIGRNEGAIWAGSVKVKLLRDMLELLT